MWDKAGYAVRRSLHVASAQLGSWRLSIVLMVLAALYFALLAIWSSASPPHVVRNIAGLLPFWIVYALMLANTGVCLWRRLPGLVRDTARAPNRAGRPADWTLESPAGIEPAQMRSILRSGGFRRPVERDGGLAGVRRRFAALGTYLFHGAFFVLAAGFLLTLGARQDASVWVAVGENFVGAPDQFRSRSAPRALLAGVPDVRFQVERIFPEFWRDELLFTNLEARLTLPDGSTHATRINRPLWLGPATFLRLSGFGYAPRYELTDPDGRVRDSTFVKLDVFPPGQRDYFQLEGLPHRFYVEVLPDLDPDADPPSTRSLNLVRPGVVLRVLRGRLDLGGGTVTPNDPGFEFEGMRIRFPEIRYWGEFAIVRDPGAPIVFLGYLLGLAGLALKLGGGRAEIAWSPGANGAPGQVRGWGCAPPARLERGA
jgi:hypothetical protein